MTLQRHKNTKRLCAGCMWLTETTAQHRNMKLLIYELVNDPDRNRQMLYDRKCIFYGQLVVLWKRSRWTCDFYGPDKEEMLWQRRAHWTFFMKVETLRFVTAARHVCRKNIQESIFPWQGLKFHRYSVDWNQSSLNRFLLAFNCTFNVSIKSLSGL